MIRFWVLVVGSLSFIATLAAHDVQTGGVSSDTLTSNFVVLKNSPVVALVTEDGDVSVNWEATEKTVAEVNTDPMTLAIARLMLAIRDGTWKPLR